MSLRTVFTRFEALIPVLCCLVASPLVTQEAAAAAPTRPPVLSVGHAFDEASFQQRAFELFAKGVADANVAQLQLIPARKFGDSDRALLDAARKGQIDLAVIPFDVVADVSEPFGIFTTPFLFDDFRHLRAVQKGALGQRLLLELRRTEVVGVGWWAGEFAAIAGERPVLEPSDLVDRRIWFQQSSIEGLRRSPFVPEWSHSIGTQPFMLPPAPPNAPLSFSAAELIEVTPLQLRRTVEAPKFITLTNHLNAGYVVVANSARWDKLPAKSRTDLIDAFERAYGVATEGLQRQQDALRQAAPGNAAVLTLAAADRREWLERTRVPQRDNRIGTLIAQVREYPVARLVSTPAPEAGISWNVWLEDGLGKDATALVVGRVSHLNIDLGRLPYQRLLRNSADTRIKAGLSSGEPLRLLIQPILLGSQLEAAPGHPFKAVPMTATLKNATTLATDEAKRQAHWDGKLTTRALAATLGMSDIAQWSVKGNQEGCADVAFVVWDEARIEPLDHVVVSVPVQRLGGPPVTCYGKAGSKEMASGLETLLRLPRSGGTAADASLHVFEYNEFGSTRSVAVLVHARRLAAARSDPAATDPGVYSWELVSPLSAYASDPGQLPKLIAEAHERLANGKPFPYEDVAGDLATVLFAGKSERDAQQGKLASEALKDAVNTGSPGRVLARLVNEGGKSMYLPLGLLAAGASKPFVAKRFSVIQSLTGGSAGPPACIRSWHVARSPTLQGAVGSAKKLLGDAPAQLPAPAKLMTTHEAVAKYLGSQPTDTQGEGFIVLAHHDAGSLRFSPEHRPPPWIRSDNINRRFPAGSIAVLAACSTTGSSQQTSAVVNRLASQGIASIVLSPFAVDIEYGVRLALAFERQVLKELDKPTGATAATLFERSAAEVAASLPAGAALQDMSLEFQLVGDPDVTICTP
jgi:TRAP-type C4-dicarboxylate transport system substrate-binding protein